MRFNINVFTDIDECIDVNNTPCLNGGQCTNTVGSYTCDCANGYTSENCASGRLDVWCFNPFPT